MKFLVFLALAVVCVVAQSTDQGLEEQIRDKRTLLLQTYSSLYPSLYRSVIPTTYAAHYPYTYPYVYPYSYYASHHSLPYVYYK
ncbi:hypothetical protein GE061_017809 [Apolygus lucorum]|uniref:Uncharacterized protein n=1 Tax=Apolygus lucorum TaxID=248454 RepID=A0A8S9XG34_APOLU|nr:hypothetical protein GE061_017809 [Apolygus lucorum]